MRGKGIRDLPPSTKKLTKKEEYHGRERGAGKQTTGQGSMFPNAIEDKVKRSRDGGEEWHPNPVGKERRGREQ